MCNDLKMPKTILFLREATVRLLLLAGGVLMGLLVAEGGMRAAGSMYRFYRLPPANSATSTSGQQTILSIGDSFTFGVGAVKGKSYPEALSRRLIEGGLGDVRVINGGVPGTNTTEMLKELRVGVEKHKPDIVLFWGGANNNNIFRTINNYTLFARSRSLLPEAMRRWRTVRLLVQWMEKAAAVAKGKESKAGFPEFSPPSPKVQEVLRREEELRSAGHWDQSVALMRASLPAAQSDPYVLSRLGWLLLGKPEHRSEGAALLERSLAIGLDNLRIRISLAEAYLGMHENQKARIHLRVLYERDPKGSTLWRNLLAHEMTGPEDYGVFRKVIEWDIALAARFCARRGISLVLQTYAAGMWPNEAIVRAAQTHGLALIDNSGITAGEFFAADGHFNGLGYAVVADNTARVLLSIENR